MAIRLKTKFHTRGQRSPATLASVVAVLAWKLALESIKRMRKADYDIDAGRPYFDFVCEFLAFLAVCADRIAYRELDAAERVEFTTVLAQNIGRFVEENNIMLLGEATFHQVHGGVATNAPVSRWDEFNREYAAIRGHGFERPRVPFTLKVAPGAADRGPRARAAEPRDHPLRPPALRRKPGDRGDFCSRSHWLPLARVNVTVTPSGPLAT